MNSHRSAPIFGQWRCEELPALMGVLNVTPDSFYDGGKYYETHSAVERALTFKEHGVDIVDIGGQSTRPGSEPVSVDQEIERTVPVIRELRDRGFELPISIDTPKSDVAKAALDAGANWVNDVTALRGDPSMGDVIARREVPVVLMHMQGKPKTMQENPTYDDVITDIREFFQERVAFALEQGIDPDQIILDPGIGFGKTLEHNRRILSEAHRFRRLGFPIMIGHSRKSFLEMLLGRVPSEAKDGTLAVSYHLLSSRVDLLRVHDVRAHDDLRRIHRWLEYGDA